MTICSVGSASRSTSDAMRDPAGSGSSTTSRSAERASRWPRYCCAPVARRNFSRRSVSLSAKAGGNSSGQLLLAALLVIAVMTLLGMGVLATAQMEYRMAVRQKTTDGAWLAAESGVEYAMAMMRAAAPDEPYQGGELPVMVNGCRVTVSTPILVLPMPSENIYEVTSRAQGRASRAVWAQILISADRKTSRQVAWKEVR